MADVQRKVSLIFEANTNQAKQSINDLVASLQKIQATPTSLIDPTGIKEASKAALELQSHIQKAINVDTGKLDLSRFSTSLSNSGKSLEHYRATLTSIGPDGEKAFKQLLHGINNAEVSTVRLTKGMRDFVNTMKNTVKWQISSSMMHGLMGAIQSAYGYAKSLDASLNNIRIVTGQSTEQMAKFAVEANRAAKSLSTTTTRYTDAALIFYQQGLSDQAVKERTEAVIKMANVTGEVASDVSSYMTAIWNNFADGSHTLEYYADVITKLGAATAASSEEIAGGLEKFAAIGNTIGLSYEYATSMITTIVDKTRQSEDVVGTALKTILARVQGLNLGETLEDGTTLNKYSNALAKVGINIKDTSGELKDMDTILDELGGKWGTLSKDTQIALAQVVGGVRQYNQIIALMDNWGAFQQNVNIAETATGSLNEQADIYAESWEAARNRVTSAAQGIYDALINEEVFIDLDNVLTSLLTTITGVVEGMGGMMPILGTIGGFITQKLSKEAVVAAQRIRENLAIFSGKAENQALTIQKQTSGHLLDLKETASAEGDLRSEAEYTSMLKVSQMREQLIMNSKNMNSAQIEEYQMLIKNEEALGQILAQRNAILAATEKETNELQEQIALRASEKNIENTKEYKDAFAIKMAEEQKKFTEAQGRVKNLKKKKAPLTDAEKMELEQKTDYISHYNTVAAREAKIREELRKEYENKYGSQYQTTFSEMGKYRDKIVRQTASQDAKNEFGQFLNSNYLKNSSNQADELRNKFEKFKETLKLNEQDVGKLRELENIIKNLGNASDLTEKQIKEIEAALQKIDMSDAAGIEAAKEKLKGLGLTESQIANLTAQSQQEGRDQNRANYSETIEKPKVTADALTALTSAAGAAMSVYGAFNAIISVHNTLLDENASGLEKVGAVMGTLMSIMMAVNSVMEFSNSIKNIGMALSGNQIIANGAEAASTIALGKAKEGLIAKNIKLMATNPYGWMLRAVLIAGALIASIYAVVKAMKAEEEAVKKLEKRTEGLRKSQEKLQERISNVQSAWDNYQETTKALEECTKGTEEWNTALMNCNQSVLTLLSFAPELSKFVRYNADGTISLAGYGVENYLEQLNRQNAAAQQATFISQNEEDQARIQLNLPGEARAYQAISRAIINENLDISNSDDLIRLREIVNELVGQGLIKNSAEFMKEAGLTGSGNLDQFNSYMASWNSQLIELEGLQASLDAGYSVLFSDTNDFNAENARMYGKAFEEATEEAKKNYSDKDRDYLVDEAIRRFGGTEDYYKDIENETLIAQLAITDVAEDFNTLSGIVREVNSSLEGLSEIGKSLAKTGNLSQVKGSELRLIGTRGRYNTELLKGLTPEAGYLGDNALFAAFNPYSLDIQYGRDSTESGNNLRNRLIESGVGEKEIEYILTLPTVEGKEEYSLPQIISEMELEINPEDLTSLFGVSLEDFDGEDGAEEFAEKFGLTTSEMLEDGVVLWKEVADQYNDLVNEAKENTLWNWNNTVGNRFQASGLKWNPEANGGRGAYERTGESLSLGDQYFQSLENLSESEKNLWGSFIGSIEEDLSTEDISSITDFLIEGLEEGLEFSELFPTLEKIFEYVRTTGEMPDPEEFDKIIRDTGGNLEYFRDSSDSLDNSLNRVIDSTWDLTAVLEELSSSLSAIRKIADLSYGEEIDAEDYEGFIDYTDRENFEKLFIKTAEGYRYYGDEETARQQMAIARRNAYNEDVEKISSGLIAGEALGVKTLYEEKGLGGLLSILSSENRSNLDALANIIGLNQSDLETLLKAYQDNTDSFEKGNYVGEDEAIRQAYNNYVNALTGYAEGNYDTALIDLAATLMGETSSTEEFKRLRGEGYFKDFDEDTLNQHEIYLAKQEYEDIGISSEDLQTQIEYMEDYNLTAGLTGAALVELAASQLRFNRGVENGQGNLKEWTKQLAEAKKGSKEYQEAQEGIVDTFADILDLDWEEADIQQFAESSDNLELMEKALEGSAEALDELQTRAAETNLTDMVEGIEEVPAEISTILDEIAALGSELEFGEIDSTEAQNKLYNAYLKLYEAAIAGGASVSDAMAIANQMMADVGFDIPDMELSTETVKITSDIPDGWEPQEGNTVMANGQTLQGVTWKENDSGTVEYYMTVPKPKGSKGWTNTNKSVGKSSKSGGGGGEGSKAPSATKKEDKDRERYHTITNQLEDLTDVYDKVSKSADRAFGKERIKLLKEQEKALRDLAATQQDYINEINAYYQQDLSNLGQVASFVGFDVQLDENGTITNFDAIQDAMLNAYNSHINDKEEVIGMDEEAWKAYEKEWEDIMALIEQYEETQDLRKEALQQLQDYINEIYDLQLEEVTYSVEINIDSAEFAMELLDHLLEQVKDEAWEAAEAIAYMSQQASNFLEQNATYETGIREILMNHTRDIVDSDGNILQSAGLTEEDIEKFLLGDLSIIDKLKEINFTQDEMDTLKDYHSQLIETSDALIKLREEVYETVITSFEAFNEEMDESIKKMDHLIDITNSYRNIVELVGQENLDISNALLESVGQTVVDQSINKLDSVRNKRDTILNEIQSAEEALEAMRIAGLEEDVKLWEEKIKVMRESLTEAEKEFMETWEATLEAVNEQFELTINNIGKVFSDMLAGPMRSSLNELQNAFERQADIDSLHLADYEKIYELSKLSRDIAKSMDETDSIAGKQELADLQAEINELEKDGVQLSTYQTEDLRRRYELRLAEIALMEAQNAKSQVQMRRDANGNWNYVYTADEEAVAQAEQDYEDKLFQIQDANAEYINTMQEMLIQTQIEMAEKIQEISLDETLSMEEKEAMIDEFTQYYNLKFNEYSAELGLVLNNNGILYERDWTRYGELTGYKISADQEYISNFKETTLSVLTGYETMEEYQNNYYTSVGIMLESSSEAFKVWSINVESAMNTANTSTENFVTTMEDSVYKIMEDNNALANNFETLGNKIQSTFADIADNVKGWGEAHSKSIDDAINKNAQMADSYGKLLKAMGEYEAEKTAEENKNNNSNYIKPNSSVDNSITNNKNGSGGSGGGPGGSLPGGEVIINYIASPPNGGNPTGPNSLVVGKVGSISPNPASGYQFSTIKVVSGKDCLEGTSITTIKALASGSASVKVYYELNKNLENKQTFGSISKFDTGGYTGAWGSSGRMAVLHEKELVLNKEDTKNMLHGIEMIRQISNVIDLNAFSTAGYMSSMNVNRINLNAQPLEQHVTISAEFPNATNKEEIYSAFNELVNLASQYAGKK